MARTATVRAGPKRFTTSPASGIAITAPAAMASRISPSSDGRGLQCVADLRDARGPAGEAETAADEGDEDGAPGAEVGTGHNASKSYRLDRWPRLRSRGDVIPLREATRTWFAISLQTFGGPAGQIAVMQHHLVDRNRWLSQRRFLHALNYCMLLPGPEAQQLAIYTGWLLNGVRGGLIAGILFVLPGMLALLALSAIYVGFGDTALVAADLRRPGPGCDRHRGPGRVPAGPALADPSRR